jgi:hypothetical protein
MGKTPAKRGSPAKPKKKPQRSMQMEIELRLMAIEDRLKAGLSPAEIKAELISEHFPHCNQVRPDGTATICRRHLGLTKRQAENYMGRVTERLREASSQHRGLIKDQILAMQFRCYQGAFARQDFGEASRIAARISELEGFKQNHAPMPALLAFLQDSRTDRDRFPDSNYQLQVLLRDLLAEAARRAVRGGGEASEDGDKKAYKPMSKKDMAAFVAWSDEAGKAGNVAPYEEFHLLGLDKDGNPIAARVVLRELFQHLLGKKTTPSIPGWKLMMKRMYTPVEEEESAEEPEAEEKPKKKAKKG